MPEARLLDFEDEVLDQIEAPNGLVRLIRGLGSGLARRQGDPPEVIWAVGDRGPNVSVTTAVKAWGMKAPPAMSGEDGAKIMPRPDMGPAVGELRLEADAVQLVRVLPLRAAEGASLSGLPTPGGPHSISEPAYDLEGRRLSPDPSGADTEGLAAVSDGSFWVGDEYGPSLLRLDSEGRVIARWVPAGSEGQFEGAANPVLGVLPALAAARRLNRGFEALALSADEQRLHLAFQSPLAHPDKAAHEAGRHVRFWTLDAQSGALLAQHLYPLDPPESFRRDAVAGTVGWADLKVSELTRLSDGRLLVLERGSATTKLYAVELRVEDALAPEHMDPQTRPTLEQLSAAEALGGLPVLTKRLVLSTDDLPEVSPDLEGMVRLSSRELLLVNDNDFGVEGVETRFWRVTLDEDVL